MNTLLYKSKEKQILEAVDLAGIFKMESQTKKVEATSGVL